MTDLMKYVSFLVLGLLLLFSVSTAHALPTPATGHAWVNAGYWSLTDTTTGGGGEATFTLTDRPRVLNKLDGLDPFDHLKAELILDTQP